MKIRPVILCGGAGTRLWPNSKNHQAKQFIDFGNWTLLGKTLERTKASIYDSPIISTNKKYLKANEIAHCFVKNQGKWSKRLGSGRGIHVGRFSAPGDHSEPISSQISYFRAGPTI